MPRNYWAVGLDIGYSAVKGISPAHYFCFPGIRKKIPENRPLLKEAADTDIRYRDKEGEWIVGNLAYEEMDASKMTESEEEVSVANVTIHLCLKSSYELDWVLP